MFKPTKIKNENAIKKNFFSIKKKEIDKSFIYQNIEIKNTLFFTQDKISNIPFPKENEFIFVTTKKANSTTAFIKNKKIKNCFIFSNACRPKFLKEIELIINGICFRETLKNNIDDLLPILIKNKIEYKFLNIHSKIIIFQDFNGNNFIIEGTGNPSINARNEVYIISNNIEKYNQLLKLYNNA